MSGWRWDVEGTATEGLATRLLRMTVLAVALASVLPLGPMEGAFPGENGRLAFAEGSGFSCLTTTIKTMNPDGSDVRTLVGGGRHPEWSPDGRQLAYHDGSRNIWTINQEGSGRRFIATGEFPSWSPDATKLVFQRPVATVYSDLWTADVRSLAVTRLTARQETLTGPYPHIFSDAHYHPEWSPTIGTIVFGRGYTVRRATGESGTNMWGLWTVRADGSNLAPVLEYPQGDGLAGLYQFPDWSPDAGQIAFLFNRFSTGAQVATVAASGGSPQTVTSPPNHSQFPAFAPDGTGTLAYVTEIPGATTTWQVVVGGRVVYSTNNSLCALDWQRRPAPQQSLAAAFDVETTALAVGDEFTVTLVAFNDGEVELTQVAPASPPTAVAGSTGRVELVSGPVPASVDTLSPLDLASFEYRFRATGEGAVVLRAGVVGTGASGQVASPPAKSDPLLINERQFTAVAFSPMGGTKISAPFVNGVLAEFESGDSVSYQGNNWDPNGDAISVLLESKTVGTYPAASMFDGDVGAVRLPESSSSDLAEACKATLTARQGTTERRVTLQGTPGEEVVSARNVNVVDAANEVFREAADGTILCEGERGVEASTGDFVLVTRSLGRTVQGGQADLFPDLDHPYPGLWFAATKGSFNADVSGLWGRAFFDGGGTTYEQVSLAAPTAPALFDPGNPAPYPWLELSQEVLRNESDLLYVSEKIYGWGGPWFFTQNVTAVRTLIFVDGDLAFDGSLSGQATTIVTTGSIVFRRGNVSLEHYDDPHFVTLLAGKGVFFGVDFDETVLAQPAAQGDTTLDVAITAGFEPGDPITLCPGCPNQEDATVTAIGSLILAAPLAFDHAAGEPIVKRIPPPATGLAIEVTHAKIDFDKDKKDKKDKKGKKSPTDRADLHGLLALASDATATCGADVTVALGGTAFSETIPGARFEQHGRKCVYKQPKDKNKKASQEGVEHLDFDLVRGHWRVTLKAALDTLTNPVDASLAIGPYAGSDTMLMREHAHHWDFKR